MEKEYKDWAIIITRAQPFHKGHLEIVKQMLETHDNILILIGSANKEKTLRNPFNENIRYWMIKSAISTDTDINNKYSDKNIEIKPLNDWSMENFSPAVKEWGKYLYYSIVYITGCKTFDFYYNDNISIIQNWFTEELLERINFITTDRNQIMNGISSTKIREALLNNNNDYLKFALPMEMKDIESLKKIYKKVIKNPKDDFIMN